MKGLVAFTGAGISKASGIPTFEEMGDLREKLNRDFFNEHTEEFYRLIREMKSVCDKAQPNPAHIALAKYDIPVVTMNIDGLHQRANTKTLIEIHGSLVNIFCENCKTSYDLNVTANSIYCKDCSCVLQTDVVLYGDQIPRYSDASKLIRTADELLVIGTSFYTSTSTYFVNEAKYVGAKITLINEEAENKVPKYLSSLFD